MDASEAAATGALPGDVSPTDLKPEPVVVVPKHRGTSEAEMRVPGGATDPIWYLAADWLVPHLARSAQRVWIEGFVAALEATRGLDGDTGLTSALRNSLSLDVGLPEC